MLAGVWSIQIFIIQYKHTVAADSTDIRAATMEIFGVLFINVIVVLLVPVVIICLKVGIMLAVGWQ